MCDQSPQLLALRRRIEQQSHVFSAKKQTSHGRENLSSMENQLFLTNPPVDNLP